jgi:signal transduction histidine kinase
MAVTVIVEGVLGAAALVRMAGGALDPIVLPSYQLGLIVAAAVLVAQGIWGRGGSVSDVTVELGNREGGTVQDTLARVLGDPTLRLAAIDPLGHGLTDESGEPVELPADPGPGRARTSVPSSGPTVALLDHETGALADPALVGPVTALIRVAVDNARTQIDIAHRMAELEKSRRALVRAVDTERRLLEGDLRGGALESLACAADVLRTLPDDPDTPNSQIAELLRRAAESVSEFARGVHPRILDAKGLPDALGELAGRCPIPVTVQVPQVRLPLDLELTLYFVASEALTNVVKHAEASIATIHLTASAGQVRMEVSDDGAGGANPDRGSGLLGLADRLAVLGGTLSVTSKPGAGSAVVATLPRVPPAVVNGSN